MSYVFRSYLPVSIIDHVKLYTGEGFWRKNKYINVYRIPKDDPRYEMLQARPKIKQLINDASTIGDPLRGAVWFKLPNQKFVVITVRYGRSWGVSPAIYGTFWEMHYNSNYQRYYIGE